MKFIPILFSSEMVNATLEERKTHTRRVVKSLCGKENVIIKRYENKFKAAFVANEGHDVIIELKPKAQIGDVFWVREAFMQPSLHETKNPVIYKASKDGDFISKLKSEPRVNSIVSMAAHSTSWKSSIFMPKWACRIFLEVTDVRIERLQDISNRDARKEGVINGTFRMYFDYNEQVLKKMSPAQSFKTLWQSINGEESWDSNPYVWVYEFKQIEKPSNFK